MAGNYWSSPWAKRSYGVLGGLGAIEAGDIARHWITGKGQSLLPNKIFGKWNPGIKPGFKSWITSGPTRGSGALLRGAANPLTLGLLSMAYSKPAGARSDIPDTSFGPVEGIKVIKKKKKKKKAGPR